MEASGVFGAAAAIAAFAGGALCAQAVLRRTRRRRAGEGGIGQHLARNGVRCADGVARRLLSMPKVAALAGDAQAALQVAERLRVLSRIFIRFRLPPIVWN